MRLTKRAPDAGDCAVIPSSFLRLSVFPVGRLRRPHPSAGNANRWAREFLILFGLKGEKFRLRRIYLWSLVDIAEKKYI